MNALYGYPMSGSQFLGAVGHQGLGMTEEEAKPGFLDVLSGRALATLQAMKAENKKTEAQLDVLQDKISRMPEGVLKQQAVRGLAQATNSYTAQYASFVSARSAYNDIIHEINTRTTGKAFPVMSGFGAVPVIVYWAGATFAISVGIAILVSQMTNAIGAWNGQVNATKGVIDQVGDTVEKSGIAAKNALDAAGRAALNVGQALNYAATAALVGVAVYFLFKVVKSGRAERVADVGITKLESSAALTGPALKPVAGTVL